MKRILWQIVVGLTLGVRADFHVAVTGSDDHPGTESRPFATFERAREAVRARKREGPLPAGGVTVWLHAGEFVRKQPFELSGEDSGTAESPVVWRAWRGDLVRVLGGRRLSGFSPVTEATVRERLAEAARDSVRVCDLRTLGMTDYGTMKSRGFGRPTSSSHCELFWEGRPMTLARWPDEGAFEQIAGFPEGTARGDDHGGKIGELAGGFFYAGDRPRRWREVSEVWVHGYWAWDWANSYERVASIDLERRLVRTEAPHGLYGFRKGQRYYFLNVLEELDRAGEWYLDRAAGRLYFWPPGPGIEGGGAEVLLSLLDGPLFRLTEVSYVRLEGLVIEATRGSGVEMRGGTDNRLAGCLVRNVGNHGVVLQGGIGLGVLGCDVFDTGDGGVDVTGGDRRTLTPGGHFVENCHFRRQGRWSKCYVPAVHLQGVGLRAAHNLIEEHPHCAILYGGNDHVMEFNEIHHVALETGDVGAIYTGRDYTYRGNRIRHNFIHEVGGVGMGSMGAYMDDCVSGTEIYGNVFFRVQRAAFLGGGRDHRVENNVFYECNHAVELDGRGLDPSPVWRGMVDRTMRQRLEDVPLALYRERYPELCALDAHYGPPDGTAIVGEAFKGVPPENNRVVRNVCVGKWLNVYWHAKPGMLRLEHNVTGDATALRFVRPPGDPVRAIDFALAVDSPAWGEGFQALPLEAMGLRDDEWRRAVPRPKGGAEE